MRCAVSRALAVLTLLVSLPAQSAHSEPPFQVRIADLDTWTNDGVLVSYTYGQLNDIVTFTVWAGRVAGPDNQVGGFDFTICFDESALLFMGIAPGADLHPDWEYFTHQQGDYGDSCAACPNGWIRVFGIANTAGGITPAEEAYNLDGSVAELSFQIRNIPGIENTCPPLEFCTYDCTDNVIASRDGDTLYIPASGIIPGPVYDSAVCRAVDPGKVLPEIAFAAGWVCVLPDTTCACPFRSDLDESGTVDATDLSVVIDVVFFGGADISDPNCLYTRSDFNITGNADATDLALLINHVFFGGIGPADPCAP